MPAADHRGRVRDPGRAPGSTAGPPRRPEGATAGDTRERAPDIELAAVARFLRNLVRSTGDPRSLGAVRIFLGAAGLLAAWETTGRLGRMTDPTRLRQPALEVLGDGAIPVVAAWALSAVWVASSTAFLVGWRTRLAGAVLALLIAGVIAADVQLYSNHLYLLALLVSLATVGDAGATLSWDSRRSAERSVPGWPIILMSAQVSLVYGFAALSKINESFLTGGVLSGVVGGGLVPVPDGWIRFETMLPLALGTVAVEAFLSMGLWMRRTRPVAVAAGIGFHLATILLMAPVLEFLVFSVTLVPTYALFQCSAPTVSRAWARARPRESRSRPPREGP